MHVDQMACVISQVGEKGSADNWRLSGHLKLYTPTDARRVGSVGIHIVRYCSMKCHDISVSAVGFDMNTNANLVVLLLGLLSCL